MTDSHETGSKRRDVLEAIGAGAIGASGLVATGEPVAAADSSSHYHNPTHPYESADPTVVRTADGTYFAYASNMERDAESQEAMVPILRSTDLVDWVHRRRVRELSGLATAETPEGPFTDRGRSFGCSFTLPERV